MMGQVDAEMPTSWRPLIKSGSPSSEGFKPDKQAPVCELAKCLLRLGIPAAELAHLWSGQGGPNGLQ